MFHRYNASKYSYRVVLHVSPKELGIETCAGDAKPQRSPCVPKIRFCNIGDEDRQGRDHLKKDTAVTSAEEVING
jgi:hypothetical protein